MKKLKCLLLIVSILCVYFAELNAQYYVPTSVEVRGVIFYIPADHTGPISGIPVFLSYSDNQYKETPSRISMNPTSGITWDPAGNTPQYITCTASSEGTYNVSGHMVWGHWNGSAWEEITGPDDDGPITIIRGPSVSISGSTNVQHALSKYDPARSYTWTANVSNGTSPFYYTWKKNGVTVGNSSSYTESYGYNGEGGGYSTFTLSVEVEDPDFPANTSTEISVTEWNSGYQEP